MRITWNGAMAVGAIVWVSSFLHSRGRPDECKPDVPPGKSDRQRSNGKMEKKMRARFVVLAAISMLMLLSISSVGIAEAKPDSPDQNKILIVHEGETVVRGSLYVKSDEIVIIEEGGTLIVRNCLTVDGIVEVNGLLIVGYKGKPEVPLGHANRPDETPSGTIPAIPAEPHPGEGPATPATPAQPGHPNKDTWYVCLWADSFPFGGYGFSADAPRDEVLRFLSKYMPDLVLPLPWPESLPTVGDYVDYCYKSLV